MKILYRHLFPSPFTSVYAACIAMLAIFCLPACKKTTPIDEHPAFVKTIYKRMDTAQNKYLDQGFAFIDSAFSTLSNPGTGDIFAKDSIKQSKYVIVKHDYIKAVAYLDSMMALTRNRLNEEKYAERYATVLYEKGECFMNMKRYNESFYYISLAEEASLKFVKNKCNIIYYSSKKAYLMFAQEKYLESIPYFKKQYQLILSACDQDGYRKVLRMAKHLNNVGLAYMRAGITDSAVFYQQAALQIIAENEAKYPVNKLNILYAKGVIYGDQGEVLTVKGKYAEAEDIYKKSIAATTSMDIGYTQSTQARLAAVYLKDNKTDAAHIVLTDLKISLDTVNNEKQLLSWYKLSVKYYAQVNQVANAFAWQQQYEIIRDSVEARDKKFIAVDIGKEFENMELKYSNEILQKEDKLKNLYLIIAVLIFIAAAAIALFVWYNLKRTRKLHLAVKQKNEDMQRALSSLEQSHQENSHIVRIVAHDLKSPISAINNLTYSVLKKDYSAEIKDIFQLIKTACGSSMTLINNALTQKKDMDATRTGMIGMKPLVEYCIELLEAKAGDKKQLLRADTEDITLMLNRQKMWRVISNIINNAITCSPENTVIDIKLQRRKNNALLSVHDNGIGIPRHLKDKIFTAPPDAAFAGTLGNPAYRPGLSICQKIVEEHHGRIWFESTDGKGTDFFVELPLDR